MKRSLAVADETRIQDILLKEYWLSIYSKFIIRSYIKINPTVTVILVGGQVFRTQFWNSITQERLPQIYAATSTVVSVGSFVKFRLS